MFRPEQGERLVFDVTATVAGSRLDSVLHLYNSRGRQVAYDDDDDDGDTLDFYLDYRVSSDDGYYVKVRGFGNRGGVGYFYDLDTSK